MTKALALGGSKSRDELFSTGLFNTYLMPDTVEDSGNIKCQKSLTSQSLGFIEYDRQ